MIRFTTAAILSLSISSTPALAAADGEPSPTPPMQSTNTVGANVDPSFVVQPEAAAPASRGVLPALYAGLAGLEAYDSYSTMRGLQSGAVEANGAMKNIAGNPVVLWAVKGAVTAASIVAAERLWKDHRRGAAIATMLATNGVMVIAAARNASVLNGRR